MDAPATPTPAASVVAPAAAPAPAPAKPGPSPRDVARQSLPQPPSRTERLAAARAAGAAEVAASGVDAGDGAAASPSAPERPAGTSGADAATPSGEPPFDKALHKHRMELHRRDRELRDAKRQHEQEVGRAREFQRLSQGSTEERLRAVGLDPRVIMDEAIIRALKEGAPEGPDPVAQQIAQQVDPVRQELERLRNEAQRHEHGRQLEHHVMTEVVPVVADPVAFEALHAFFSDSHGKPNLRAIGHKIAEARAEHYQMHGEWMPIQEAAARLDRFYDQQLVGALDSVGKMTRYQARFAAGGSPAAGAANQKFPPGSVGSARSAPVVSAAEHPAVAPRQGTGARTARLAAAIAAGRAERDKAG